MHFRAAACAAIAAALFVGTPAFATDFDAGDFSAGSAPFVFVPPVDTIVFTDTWTFRLSEMLPVAITVQAIDVGSFVLLDVTSVSGGLPFDSSGAPKLYTFSGELAAGEYTVGVNGTPTGSQGGQYAFAMAVPEPGAALMMGFGLLGLAAHCRFGIV